MKTNAKNAGGFGLGPAKAILKGLLKNIDPKGQFPTKGPVKGREAEAIRALQEVVGRLEKDEVKVTSGPRKPSKMQLG